VLVPVLGRGGSSPPSDTQIEREAPHQLVGSLPFVVGTTAFRRVAEVPGRTELRRLGLIVVVMLAVGATTLIVLIASLCTVQQRLTAVPGWGHCTINWATSSKATSKPSGPGP
jgi:heme/copper-type cytochrome/quinol oxidase subunit 1